MYLKTFLIPSSSYGADQPYRRDSSTAWLGASFCTEGLAPRKALKTYLGKLWARPK
jgi:hypothetical protein